MEIDDIDKYFERKNPFEGVQRFRLDLEDGRTVYYSAKEEIPKEEMLEKLGKVKHRVEFPTKDDQCEACFGSGTIMDAGIFSSRHTCETCGGTGKAKTKKEKKRVWGIEGL